VSRAVATPHVEATAAARRAYGEGGNALDAALAAAVALTVVYPHNCGVGGDLFALVRGPDGALTNVNASGPAARGVDVARLRATHRRMPARGPDPITVPGVVAGWEALHRLGAALPWDAAFAAAIGLAEEGVPVARSLAAALAEEDLRDPGMRAVFAPGGPLRQPALARTLRELAAGGADALYRGELGARLAAGLRRAGSPLDRDDLAVFAPELGAPASVRFRGLDVHTSPPNSSGVLLLQALAALEHGGSEDPGRLATIFRLGDAQRERALGDPRVRPVDLEDWIGAERIAAVVRTASAPPVPALDATGDTVAVVASDGEWTVSLIQSLFGSFGARVLEPETGILLHNRGRSFSLEPGHPAELGPGRRPPHTLMPVLAERDGRLAGALGTMGGRAHAQIHAQLLLRLTAGEPPQAAVDAPRWVVGTLDTRASRDAARVEAGVPDDVRRSLAAAGAVVTPVGERSEEVGHAQAVWVLSDGTLAAGSDPRADGGAAVI
jgi:gamma-glutamyltranspeptidase/glutathione hydrolase